MSECAVSSRAGASETSPDLSAGGCAEAARRLRGKGIRGSQRTVAPTMRPPIGVTAGERRTAAPLTQPKQPLLATRFGTH
eukprot:CAMPEP_0171700180 /NCGR_PEP_ID=MMETSP0991-20121206/10392_1 /TAXON_ID=483369 /ORGANISM="non described non described, Strain CCMP2098" /LENGTH=79 /DNA_ID=CAMNT_0012289373 /DNA_START=42 /DNA_END=281 /DNA_ORIENTATION=+